MQLTFWGVRGSIATSGPEFSTYGGNTTCLEVTSGDDRIILDAGTGLRALGQKLMAEASQLGAPIRTTFLFSHLHWDHIQGFPFFAPAFLPNTELNLYGPMDENGEHSLQDVLSAQMRPPSFPVTLDAMASHKSFHTIRDSDELGTGGFDIRMKALCHPQGSLGFRIEAGGRSLCFATDTEHREDGTVDEALLDLARDVDLLVYDAQYTEDEYAGSATTGPSRKGWGHSTYVAATQIAKACGAARLALFHHDPAHADPMVAAIERDAQSYFPAAFAAREGLTIDV